MVVEESLRIIKLGTDAWNQWRKANPRVVPDLLGADLRNAALCGADLREVQLLGADIRKAQLCGADLREARLLGADLRDANLIYADLRRTDLSEADLRGANLREAILFETILGNTNLSCVADLDSCRHFGPSILDHRTLAKFGRLPLIFLRGCGLPDSLIGYLPSLLNNPIEFYSCFISYNGKDKPFARQLYNHLQEHGIRCWLDERDLIVGRKIIDELDHAIRINDKLLLCCSEASLNSSWVEDEISMAIEKERLYGQLVLIPLLLDNYIFDGWTSGHGTRIRERLAADFTGWEHDNSKFEEGFERVIQALRSGGSL